MANSKLTQYDCTKTEHNFKICHKVAKKFFSSNLLLPIIPDNDMILTGARE